MNICICGSNDWQYLDELRDIQYWKEKDFIDINADKLGFKICKDCGHTTYDERPELEEHYIKSYRKNVQGGNIITTNRKIGYHLHFLHKYLIADKELSVLDFGCAHAQVLAALRDSYPSVKKVKGYELTEGFVNFARNVNRVEVSQEKEPNEPDGEHDIIICYHTLEHVPDPVGILSKLKKALKDDGIIYLSVPTWFESLDEPGGTTTADFENLYHFDHIQVFSRQGIRNVISLCGLEIVEFDDQIYGHTFVLRKSEPGPIVKEDYKKKIDILQRQKAAIQLFQQRKHEDAIKVYPDFPDAYSHLGMTQYMKEFEGQKKVYLDCLNNCSLKFKPTANLARLYLQWDGDTEKDRPYTNNIKMSEQLYTQMLALKPNNEESHFFLGIINAHYKKDYETAFRHFDHVLRVNPSRFIEVMQFIGWVGGK